MSQYPREEIIKEASRVLSYIEGPELSDSDKARIVEDSIRNFTDHVNPGVLEHRKSVSTDYSFVEWEDEGAIFRDTHGVEFIDCLGGFGIYTLGHRNPRVVKALRAQLDRYALHSQELVDPLRGYLAKLVAMITPGDIRYSFFCNGGAEAVEMALKLARLATGKTYYISTVGAFHGKSMGAVSVAGKDVFRKPYIPLIQGVQHVEYGNAAAMEAAIKALIAVGESVAGVIVEPVQGEGGVNIPPDDYLPRLREICDKYEVLLITDEIQTGMGRTGKMWGVDHQGVVPDILIMGKAFGGGVAPITGIAARPHLWDRLKENPWVLGSPTFGGNPLCCAAAIAAIKLTVELDIPAICAEKGNYLLENLAVLSNKYPLLKAVRGKGLLIGMEFPDSDSGFKVARELFKRRIMVGGTLNNARVVRIEPPAVITQEQMDTVLESLAEVLAEVS